MNLKVSKNELLRASLIAQKVSPARSAMPILTGILLEAGEDRLSATATNLEMTVSCTVPARVSEQGRAVVPAREFTEICRRLPEEDIWIVKDDYFETLTLKYSSSEVTFNCLQGDNFPLPPQPPQEIKFSLSQDLLRSSLRRVLFAVSSEEQRPIFSGVLFELRERSLTLVATDTHRLAIYSLPLVRNYSDQMNFVVPGKTLQELLRLIDFRDDSFDVHLSANQIFFVTADFKLVSRLIAGTYPNYRVVIPDDFVCRVHLDHGILLDSVERAVSLGRQGTTVVFLNFQPSHLTVFTNSEVGSLREEISVNDFDGQPLEICFNARYLIDILQNMPGEEVVFELTGASSPALIRPTSEDVDYTVLLVPAVQEIVREENAPD